MLYEILDTSNWPLSSVNGSKMKYEKACTRNHSHSSSNLAICLTSKDLDMTSAIGSTAFKNYWFGINNATSLWKASNTITCHQPYNLTNIDEENRPFNFVILEMQMIKFAQENFRINLAYWLYSKDQLVWVSCLCKLVIDCLYFSWFAQLM